MSKRKNPKSRFVLEEDDGVVVASLVDDYDLSLQHTIHSMPHPRIRAPRSSKDKIDKKPKGSDSIDLTSVQLLTEPQTPVD